MEGKKFNKLYVIKRVENNKHNSIQYLCKCDCGNTAIVLKDNLKNSITKSCGCIKKGINKTHGKSSHELYATWHTMKRRCYDTKCKDYKDYGGRGIKVCSRWLESITNFIEDMGQRPKGHTIDRIDNNGNYEPNNCHWVDRKHQQRNTRKNVYYFYNGEAKTLKEWSNVLNLPFYKLRYRVRDKNMSIGEALEDLKRSK